MHMWRYHDATAYAPPTLFMGIYRTRALANRVATTSRPHLASSLMRWPLGGWHALLQNLPDSLNYTMLNHTNRGKLSTQLQLYTVSHLNHNMLILQLWKSSLHEAFAQSHHYTEAQPYTTATRL